MRPSVIVLFEPVIDGGLSLLRRCKPFGIEAFQAERAIEPLVVSVLLG